jgi:hypothetical protein
MNDTVNIGRNDLSPLWGLRCCRTMPTAHAVGYSLPALRACASAYKRCEFDDAAPLIQPNQHSRSNCPVNGVARCLPNELLCWPLLIAAEQCERVAHGVSRGCRTHAQRKPRRGERIPSRKVPRFVVSP